MTPVHPFQVKVKEIFIIPWGQFVLQQAANQKQQQRKTAQQTIKTATNKTTTTDKSAGRYNNHFIKLFRSPVATGTNEFFSLFVLHLGTTYLLPEGSRVNSLKSGWLWSPSTAQTFFKVLMLYSSFRWCRLKPAILLQMFVSPCSRFLFLMLIEPYQQIKVNVSTDSIKQE